MKMGPVDGLVEDEAHNWVLADQGTGIVLIDARAASTLKLAKSLARSKYQSLWFDPSTGETKDAGQISGAAGTVIQKPNEKEWLLLLKAV